MGIYDRDYYRAEDQGWRFRGLESAWATLIVINVTIFLVDFILFKSRLGQEMAVSSQTLTHPLRWWQFLTAGFAHQQPGIWHLVGNMLGLFFFGRDVEGVYGSRKFLGFYLTAIIVANVGFSARHLLMGMDRPAIGASGAITATIILFALRFPHRMILFMMAIPIPAWVLGIIYVVYDFVHAFDPTSPTAHDIHLFGAAFGYLFYRTGWELGSLFSADRRFKWRLPKAKPRVRLYDPEKISEKLDQQADAILEKLHRQGESSLTGKERRALEEYSRRMREKRR